MTTLERLLIALIAWALSIGGAVWYGHSLGWNAREARVTADALAELRAREAKAAEGHTISEQYESKLIDLESRYEKQSARLRAALRQRVQCPASGEVGDVVLPADVVGSMFHTSAPAKAASEPAATVQ